MNRLLNQKSFRLVFARWLKDFIVRLEFEDGKGFDLDLSLDLNSIHGPLVDPLRDKEVFSKLRVEYGALVFSTGLDYGADVLRLWCENGAVADQETTDLMASQYYFLNHPSSCAA
jgi:hypothetical protein